MLRVGSGWLVDVQSPPLRRSTTRSECARSCLARLAVGETVILLHPPLPLVGVSIETMRERQQNDSLADG